MMRVFCRRASLLRSAHSNVMLYKALTTASSTHLAGLPLMTRRQRQVHMQCHGQTEQQHFPLPEDLIQELAKIPGVKVVLPPVLDPQHAPYRDPGEVDEEEEDEVWMEVMADLENPWMRTGAADADSMAQDMSSAPTGALTLNRQLFRDVAGAQIVRGAAELKALAVEHPSLVLLDLDVRLHHQAKDRQAEEFENVVHCPIEELTGDMARKLAQGPVLVLDTGDYRGSQACIRLIKVYNAQHVYLYDYKAGESCGPRAPTDKQAEPLDNNRSP